MTSVQTVVIGEHAGQRLDNFLLGQLRGVPRSRVYRMIRSGEVRINGSRCKPNTRLQVDDRVRIPPAYVTQRSAVPDATPAFVELIQRSVIYENDDLIVINKPAGVLVHGGIDAEFGLAEQLNHIFDLEGLQLAHRLDKATSGCLVVTKTRESMLKHQKLFRDGAIGKTYVAIVANAWGDAEICVDARLERFHMPNGERRVRVSHTGQPSRTLFKIDQRCAHASWVSAKPLTGRTHQIRVHAQHAGHPILGDRKYGSRTFRPQPSRLMLHANSLRIPDVGDLQAPMPLDFSRYWALLAEAD